MKKNKKILMIGTAITSIVVPVATIISCANNGGGKTPTPPAPLTPPIPPTPLTGILDISNYKEYTTYDQNTKALTIKDGITEISNIFKYGYILDPNKPSDVVQIDSLTLPSSLVKIDDDAFHTSELKTLIIPDSVTSIGDLAFFGSPLTSLALGTSLETIGESAFENN